MNNTHLIFSTSPTFTKYSEQSMQLLKENNCDLVMMSPKDFRDKAEYPEVLAKAEAWVVGINKVYAEDLDYAPKLKLIIKHGSGVDSIDLRAAAERGITVANAPGTNANAVADLAMGLILSGARQIVSADQRLRGGFWGPIMGQDVYGRTLGVLGLGQIGRGLVQRAKGFNMKILGYDVVHNPEFEAEYGVRAATLEEIVTEVDYLSVHLPLLDSTKNLIGVDALAKMKSSAFLVNTCRGGVVDEEALFKALSDKKIAGAAIDVFKKEPPVDSPFLTLDNVIVTPHMGGYTEGAMALTSEVVAQSIVNVLKGEAPLSEIKAH